jgi:FkbM family methyltransferase
MLIPFKDLIAKYNLDIKGVIHVGGHWGEEAQDYYDNGVTNTIWVEANPECMPQLKHNVFTVFKNPTQYQCLEKLTSEWEVRDGNGYRTTTINACVSEEDKKEVVFNISNNEGQSSSFLELAHHKIAHPEVVYEKNIKVTTWKLDTLLKIFKKDHQYDMLNGDIQGAELLMLKGATDILQHLKCLYLEVNQKELYTGCPLVEEIDQFLEQYDFVRVETIWCGNFGWGDAVYLKKQHLTNF